MRIQHSILVNILTMFLWFAAMLLPAIVYAQECFTVEDQIDVIKEMELEDKGLRSKLYIVDNSGSGGIPRSLFTVMVGNKTDLVMINFFIDNCAVPISDTVYVITKINDEIIAKIKDAQIIYETDEEEY